MAKLILSFSELAGMYFPGCSTPKNAVRSLQRSIKRCTNLATALVETGYQPYAGEDNVWSIFSAAL